MENNNAYKFRYRFVYDRQHENKTENLIQLEVYNPGNKRKIYISTNVRVQATEWDKNQKVVIDREGADHLNKFLYQFKNSVELLEMDYRMRGINCSLSTIKADVRAKKKSSRVGISTNLWKIISTNLQTGSPPLSRISRAHLSPLRALSKRARLTSWT